MTFFRKTSKRFGRAVLFPAWAACLLASAFLTQAANADSPRNPFALPSGVYPKNLAPKPPTPTTMKLQAVIVADKKNHIATINNKNFQVGDDAYGNKVLEISPDQVVLEGPEGRIVLQLKQPAFSIQRSDGY